MENFKVDPALKDYKAGSIIQWGNLPYPLRVKVDAGCGFCEGTLVDGICGGFACQPDERDDGVQASLMKLTAKEEALVAEHQRLQEKSERVAKGLQDNERQSFWSALDTIMVHRDQRRILRRMRAIQKRLAKG
jgi:hypothetical protein